MSEGGMSGSAMNPIANGSLDSNGGGAAAKQRPLFFMAELDAKHVINPIGEICNFNKPMMPGAGNYKCLPNMIPLLPPALMDLIDSLIAGFQEGIPDHAADLVPADVRAIFGESDIHSDGAVTSIVAQAGLRNAAMNSDAGPDLG
tara:strand:- start:989 stop:1423 length:435 start_codon:yes stop_codon:yes gene_type:complete